jgi:transposase
MEGGARRSCHNTRGTAQGIGKTKRNRKTPIYFSLWLYKQRALIERFFNKLKYFRRIATRYDKLDRPSMRWQGTLASG